MEKARKAGRVKAAQRPQGLALRRTAFRAMIDARSG